MIEECHHKGHCLHRDDSGESFVRHDQNPKGLVAVTCCMCEKKAEIEGNAKKTSAPPPSSYLPKEHGPYLAGSLQSRAVDAVELKRLQDVDSAVFQALGVRDPVAVAAALDKTAPVAAGVRV